MNWTEGNLARHSRGRKGKETLTRQKEHFAKARSGLLNPTLRSSPPAIIFFASKAQDEDHALHRPFETSTHSSRKRPRENGSEQTSHYFRASLPDSPRPGNLPESQTNDILRQKRQKLLARGDWAGTTVQRPIEIEFCKQRITSNNPWTTPRVRHDTSKQRLRHLLGVRAPSGPERAAAPAIRTMRPFTSGQVMIRVGSQEKVFGASSTASSQSKCTRKATSLECTGLELH